MLEEARASKKPIKVRQLRDCFGFFENVGRPYLKYCKENVAAVKYLESIRNDYAEFQEYLMVRIVDLFVWVN